jgi:hypothetical protein
MSKTTKAKASAPAAATTNGTPDLSWVPISTIPSDKKKGKEEHISTLLELKFISAKMDKFGRDVMYFQCYNPEAFSILKDSMDAQGLNPEQISLPFWRGEEGDYLLRVTKANCSLDEGLLESSKTLNIKVPAEFVYYSGKKSNGHALHL